MKRSTLTVRLPGVQFEALEVIAEYTGEKPSDLMRKALSAFIISGAEENEEMAAYLGDAAQEDLIQHIDNIRQVYGDQAVDGLQLPGAN